METDKCVEEKHELRAQRPLERCGALGNQKNLLGPPQTNKLNPQTRSNQKYKFSFKLNLCIQYNTNNIIHFYVLPLGGQWFMGLTIPQQLEAH